MSWLISQAWSSRACGLMLSGLFHCEIRSGLEQCCNGCSWMNS
ncbi:MAG: hypothetical protein ACLSA6_00650 [Holdemania massiliensis]